MIAGADVLTWLFWVIVVFALANLASDGIVGVAKWWKKRSAKCRPTCPMGDSQLPCGPAPDEQERESKPPLVTGFDKYVAEQMADPKFREQYERARAEIDRVGLNAPAAANAIARTVAAAEYRMALAARFEERAGPIPPGDACRM